MSCSRGCCPSQLDHYRSIRLSASATPSRRPTTQNITKDEAQFSLDRDAYKRLRENGTQPARIDGCARLEMQASTRLEVESGQLLTTKDRKQYENFTGRSANDGL